MNEQFICGSRWTHILNHFFLKKSLVYLVLTTVKQSHIHWVGSNQFYHCQKKGEWACCDQQKGYARNDGTQKLYMTKLQQRRELDEIEYKSW